ncbi:MAG: formate transporter [Methanomicrobiales archaeon HGW-Methanomicrobiales-4]|nr:MAG: formate transporter [Methanomicrobiales archaeon HGW-Methanomicrobiales-4]
MSFHQPTAILKAGSDIGIYKTRLPAWNLFLRGAMSGAYIGMGAALMVAVTSGMEITLGSGFTHFIGGAVFPLGVILTVLTGAELFTGDAMLAPMAALRHRTSWMIVARLWILVWLGNLAGSLFYAGLMTFGPLTSTDSTGVASVTSVGVATVSLASIKCGYFGTGAVLSLLGSSLAAGWLINLAVLLSLCADDAIGKIMGIWFPVMAMTATGLEHAVTNMYLIPAGILTASRLSPLQVADVGPVIAHLGWVEMWTTNLIVASIGNLLGGMVFAGLLYYGAFKKESEE